VPANDAHETVAQILRRKLGSIKNAPLTAGSPGWDDILHWTWAEVVQAKSRGEAGFKTIYKLLTNKRFDK
jgi:hypothetical protein